MDTDQLYQLWTRVREYLDHEFGCDFPQTDICTCGMVQAKRDFVVGMNTYIQEHHKNGPVQNP